MVAGGGVEVCDWAETAPAPSNITKTVRRMISLILILLMASSLELKHLKPPDSSSTFFRHHCLFLSYKSGPVSWLPLTRGRMPIFEERDGWRNAHPGVTFPALLLWREFAHHIIEVKARGLLPNGVFLEAFEPLSHNGLRRDDYERTVCQPIAV